MNKANVKPYVNMCSKTIRSSFLNYFSNVHNHHIVKSSPVVPFCDNSIAFVNSGMCQFKNVFLGKCQAPHSRVVNSQKCIRVGGKHNDLSCAGRDAYHHTFFEMLGNWSFNDYHKKEACQMAFDFLTKPPISLPLNRLYFTYFGGCEEYNLPCDEETRNIWLELGVPEYQIKKEGMTSNFWEMGSTGPCGYSSEIHFDLRGDPVSALTRVNSDCHDLIEIWNIVFVSHNRTDINTIVPLRKNFIDTGLGFERLVTILQHQNSTYDTDLFLPLLKTISTVSKMKPYSKHFGNDTDLDTKYRILSDYSRMVTVTLSDNMFPDATPKLRNIIRSALLISEDVFKVTNGKLLQELSFQVAEVLGESYPEICENLNKVQKILHEESRIFDNLRQTALKDWKHLLKSNPELNHLDVLEEPGLVQGVKYLTKHEDLTEITGDIAFTLYDTYGLSKDLIQNIASAKNLTLNQTAFDSRLNELKLKSKEKAANSNLLAIDAQDLVDFAITDDSYKYEYYFNEDKNKYVFPKLDTTLLAVVIGDQVFTFDKMSIFHSRSKTKIDSIFLEKGSIVGLVFDRSNFYVNAGGQIDDLGLVHLTNASNDTEQAKVDVHKLVSVEGKIIHFGQIDSNISLTSNIISSLELNETHRVGCMRAHTTSHLINTALRRTLTCTYQKSCRVSSNECAFDFSVYGENLMVDNVASIESFLNDTINSGVSVVRKLINSSELFSLSHVTTIPGEVYPDQISLIEIADTIVPLHQNGVSGNIISREPCCGTHVLNTSHIDSCCIINYKSYNHGVRSIKCLTGESAKQAFQDGKKFMEQMKKLEANVNEKLKSVSVEELNQRREEVNEAKRNLQTRNQTLPYIVRKQCDELLQDLGKKVKLKIRQLGKVSESKQ